jgi:hypothetical protein
MKKRKGTVYGDKLTVVLLNEENKGRRKVELNAICNCA